MGAPVKMSAPTANATARQALVVTGGKITYKTSQTRKVQVKRRHLRLRKKVVGTTERPRLSVKRTNNHMHLQIIDDTADDSMGRTLVGLSTQNKDMQAGLADEEKEGRACRASHVAAANELGNRIAAMALEKDVTTVVFDRGGHKYTGRVAAVADGAREAGLIF